jgi:hypothetical protein
VVAAVLVGKELARRIEVDLPMPLPATVTPILAVQAMVTTLIRVPMAIPTEEDAAIIILPLEARTHRHPQATCLPSHSS